MSDVQNAAPERIVWPYGPYANDYNGAPNDGRGPGIYNYSPGPGGNYNNNYYNNDRNGMRNVAPDSAPDRSPHRATPFYNVAPY
jgi:hypothetical protein